MDQKVLFDVFGKLAISASISSIYLFVPIVLLRHTLSLS